MLSLRNDYLEMESFKLVLPSNASHDHFPNNTSSHYQTYLHEPIQLEGKWEVAVESIYYSANIENEHEKASLTFTIMDEENLLVNDIYSWQFKLSSDKTWFGYKGVEIPMSNTTFTLVNDLNSSHILNKAERPLFQFLCDWQGRVTYRCSSPNFSLEIHPYIAKALGFDRHKVTFTGTGPYTGKNIMLNEKLDLDARKRRIHFFHSQLVRREQRITLKYPGEECNAAKLLALWNERIKPQIQSILEFSKYNKVILHLLVSDKALVFSPELAKAIDHYEPLIRRQTRWAHHVYKATAKMKEEHWYVDVYNTQMETTVAKRTRHETFEYHPGLFPTVEQMITFLNESIISMLKAKLKDRYNVEKHTFTLATSGQRVTLNLGSWLQLSCTPNVTQMLGFDERKFSDGSYVSSSTPYNASNRVQRVLLMTNIIESISYGNQRLRVLQDFVHNVKGPSIIEKRFQPLSFLPVIRNYIDNISIQLVNEAQQQITAKDVKTVVVLHFQRLK